MFGAFCIDIENFYENLAWTQIKCGYGAAEADKLLYWEHQLFTNKLIGVLKTINEKQEKANQKGGNSGRIKPSMPNTKGLMRSMSGKGRRR